MTQKQGDAQRSSYTHQDHKMATAQKDVASKVNDVGIHFSAPFIKRPVATFLLSVAILLAGAVAYKLLPVASLPEVEYPVISVGASFPGADPETMASAIATPLERQFSKIAGVNEMTSSSSTGTTSVTLQFDLSKSVDGAARDVQAAINAARSQLPANLPNNPTYRKINPADSPILILALTSDTLKVPQIYDACDSVLAQKIAQIQGVGQTFCGGSAKPAVRVEANPMQLANTGIGLEALRAAIGSFNVNQPKGYFQDDRSRWSIAASDQLFGAAAYAPLIIATDRGPVSNARPSSGLPASEASALSSTPTSSTANGNSSTTSSASGPTANNTTTTTAGSGASATPPASGASAEHGIVRLRDVARVTDDVEDIHTLGTYNGKPAILVIVFKSPTANVIQTVDNIMELLPTLEASIPPAIQLHVALDRTLTIRASVKDVTRTLIISILLVILVVFAFLRETRATLIPSVSVPLSLLGTFGIMYMLGYTLDNLSLMALTISTGFVVDDAIVVIENISRHLEDGLSPFDAAMVGSKEIGFTVLSMSISLIAVFIPILLMGGIVGRLFREFAVTLSVAIAVSLVVSLTTTPMLSAKFLEAHNAPRTRRRLPLRRARPRPPLLRVRARPLLGPPAPDHHPAHHPRHLCPQHLSLHPRPQGLLPRAGHRPHRRSDSGPAGRLLRRPQTQGPRTSPTSPTRIPASRTSWPSPAAAAPSTPASCSWPSRMTPGAKKHGDSADAIIKRLRQKTSNMPGVLLYLMSFQDLHIGGRNTPTEYVYSLTSDNLSDLDEWAPKLKDAMDKLPEIKDVASDQMNSGLRAQLVIDRDTASRLGVSPLTIDNTLSDAFGQAQVSTTYMPLNQYHVIMEVDQQYQRNLDALKNIYVKSTTGAMVPLTAVTKVVSQRIPLSVNHQSQAPATTLSFNLTPGVALSQATAAIEQVRIRIGMPSTIHGGFQGSAEEAKKSFASEPYLIALALFAVYIILGMLYESFIHPITILSTLPSAGVGALIALLITNTDLSVIAMIGIILLIGIVKKNAIMMIDFALAAERQGGKDPRDAIYEACLLRFRPIMMTTMAALLGGLPLALGHGTGSELRRPLGITIVGGLIVSQCLTLFTTPVVYLFFDRLRGRFANRRHVPEALPHRAAQPVAGD